MTTIKLAGCARRRGSYVVRWCVIASTFAFAAPLALAGANVEKADVTVTVAEKMLQPVHFGVETRLWEAAKGDVTPRSGRLEQCGDAQGWTFVVPAQALVHFAFDVDIGK